MGPDVGDAAQRVMRLLAGKWVTAALAAAAELGVADALAERPQTAAALAESLGCQPEPLLRLLRVLAGEGLVEEDAHGRYALTPPGAQLRDGELRQLARFVGASLVWSPWPQLARAVREGRAAFELTHGQPLFEYLDGHPEEARLYHGAVDVFTRRQARALAEVYDFSEAHTVVDVGGGLGTLLVEVARAFPHLQGILFDRPAVVGPASERLQQAGLAERCRAVGGDFLRSVPEGGDVYVLKHVIHNWDDEEAVGLLERCRRALAPAGRVLVVEGLLLPGNRQDATRLLDLEMFALCGPGKERSKPAFRHLFHRAGLRLQATRALTEGTWLLEGAPRA